MSPHSFRRIGSRIIAVLFLILVFPHVAGRCSAELLADHATVSVRQHEQWHLVRSTLLRDSTTGVLTMVPNTTVSFKDACSPTTIDPTGISCSACAAMAWPCKISIPRRALLRKRAHR
jgi:hypothetical protein